MGLWRRIITEIIRRPFRTIILSITIFVLSIMSMIGAFLQNVVRTAYQEYIKIDGYSIAVENRYEENVTQQLINEILTLKHVVGYNQSGNYKVNCKPTNFSNVPYDTNSYTSVAKSEEITLYGNLDTSFYVTFRNKNMTLMEGTLPNLKKHGVVIDSILAQKNKLEVGSEIKLYNDIVDDTKTFMVIGIYKTHEAPEIEISNSLGTYYAPSPSSYIFCDYDSFLEFQSISNIMSSVTFYIDEYDNIKQSYESIKDVVPEQEYMIINCLENTLSYYGAVIVSLENTTNLLLNFTYITSLIILFLMTVLWMRDHYYETGIYIALGTERIKIVFYFISEILMIALAALAVSFIFGRTFVYTFREKLLNIAIGFSNSEFLDATVQTKVLNGSFSYQSMLSACGIYLFIVVIATLLSSITIVNYNPRKLFDDK